MPRKREKQPGEKAPTVPKTLKFRRVVVAPEQNPLAANHFGWIRIGSEYLLEVGHIDQVSLQGAIEVARAGGEPDAADCFITHRFCFGIETATKLAEAIKLMHRDLEEQKRIKSPGGAKQ